MWDFFAEKQTCKSVSVICFYIATTLISSTHGYYDVNFREISVQKDLLKRSPLLEISTCELKDEVPSNKNAVNQTSVSVIIEVN